MQAFGSTDFTEVFRPKPVGDTVNVHVVPAVLEPKPDYDAMQRLIEGGTNVLVRPKGELQK